MSVYYSKDWFLSQVEQIIECITKVVFEDSFSRYEIKDYDSLTDVDRLFIEVNTLLNEKNICEAENILYDKIDYTDLKQFKIALDFYQKLNDLSDEELEESNFSREEVLQGLKNISNKFGIDSDFWLY